MVFHKKSFFLDSSHADFNFSVAKEKAKSLNRDRVTCPNIIKSILLNKLIAKSNREDRMEKIAHTFDKKDLTKNGKILNSIRIKKPASRTKTNTSAQIFHFPKPVEEYKNRLTKLYN